jgi:hypothetical protein
MFGRLSLIATILLNASSVFCHANDLQVNRASFGVQARWHVAQENSCPADPNQYGHGSCGQSCNTNGQTFTCQRYERPVYYKNGTCACCASSDCQ